MHADQVGQHLTYVQILSLETASLSHNSNRHAVQYKRPLATLVTMGAFHWSIIYTALNCFKKRLDKLYSSDSDPDVDYDLRAEIQVS